MSYTSLLYHIIFRTKRNVPAINETHEKELYAYMMGVIRNKKSKLYRIGGIENHIHLLVDIHPSFAVADVIKEVKEYSSKWIRSGDKFPLFEGWAVSYAAISYNIKEKEVLIEYIKNQKEHHKTISFEDEYRKLLKDNNIDINEDYFLKD